MAEPSVPVRAGILGGAGYVGGEVLRLLLMHPEVTIESIASRSQAGKPVFQVHTHLLEVVPPELTFVPPDEMDYERIEVLFSCLEHGKAAGLLPDLLRTYDHLKVVDLSADFRLKEATLYPSLYQMEHPDPDWLETFAYGLPEVYREAIQKARAVANPGCFATAIELALIPLAEQGWLRDPVVFGATGSSGSGVGLSKKVHFSLRHDNLRAYKVLRHQHIPEVLQTLRAVAQEGSEVPPIDFIPVSAPFVRGIWIAAHVRLPEGITFEDVDAAYRQFYLEAPFVRIRFELPEINQVRGSNFCDIGMTVEGDRLVVVATIDNMIKGAAGQAVQNFNLMQGYPETTGLLFPPSFL